MTRIASAALLMLAPVLAPAAHGQTVAPQHDLKIQLESQPVPVFAASRLLPGVTGSYVVSGDGCRSRIDIRYPAHDANGAAVAARTETVEIQWAQTSDLFVRGSAAVVAAPGLPGGQKSLFTSDKRAAADLVATMEALHAACTRSGGATRTAGIGDRYKAAPDILGTPQCRFHRAPGLLLTDNKPPVVKLAHWTAVPRESGDRENRLSFGAQTSDTVTNWRGILAISPAFRIQDKRFSTRQITRATLTLDGRNAGVSLRTDQKKGSSAFSTYVSVTPATVPDEGPLLGALERASVAALRLYDAAGTAYGPWTFDVAAVRNVPAALAAARWTCS